MANAASIENLLRDLARDRIHYSGNEWMACYGGSAFDAPGNTGDRKDAKRRRALVGLDNLFGADWYGCDENQRYWYEFTAYALVHYLIHGATRTTKSRSRRLSQVADPNQVS